MFPRSFAVGTEARKYTTCTVDRRYLWGRGVSKRRGAEGDAKKGVGAGGWSGRAPWRRMGGEGERWASGAGLTRSHMPCDMLGPSEGGLADWTLWRTMSTTVQTTSKWGRTARRGHTPCGRRPWVWDGDGSGDWEKVETSQTLTKHSFKSGASGAPPDVTLISVTTSVRVTHPQKTGIPRYACHTRLHTHSQTIPSPRHTLRLRPTPRRPRRRVGQASDRRQIECHRCPTVTSSPSVSRDCGRDQAAAKGNTRHLLEPRTDQPRPLTLALPVARTPPPLICTQSPDRRQQTTSSTRRRPAAPPAARHPPPAAAHLRPVGRPPHRASLLRTSHSASRAHVGISVAIARQASRGQRASDIAPAAHALPSLNAEPPPAWEPSHPSHPQTLQSDGRCPPMHPRLPPRGIFLGGPYRCPTSLCDRTSPLSFYNRASCDTASARSEGCCARIPSPGYP